MKKTFIAIFAVVVIAVTAAILTACSDSASSLVGDAISAAEKEVQITESPVLGTIPSLDQQKKAANDFVSDYISKAMDKAEKREELSELANQKKAANAEINVIYRDKQVEALKALDGKEVKVTFDESCFSAGKAKIVLTGDTAATKVSGARYQIIVELTAAKDTELCSAQVQDAEGNKLKDLAWFFDFFKNVPEDCKIVKYGKASAIKAGGTFTIEIEGINVGTKDTGLKFDHLYFTSGY